MATADTVRAQARLDLRRDGGDDRVDRKENER